MVKKLAYALMLFGGLYFSSNSVAKNTENHTNFDFIKEEPKFIQIGRFYDKNSCCIDGRVIVEENGDIYSQKYSPNFKENKLDSYKHKIGNLFENKNPKKLYLIKGMTSCDLNNDNLHEIVIKIVDVGLYRNMLKTNPDKINDAYSFEVFSPKGNGLFEKTISDFCY
mgnify:CR=1 FL=1|jgi:hypothetical protein